MGKKKQAEATASNNDTFEPFGITDFEQERVLKEWLVALLHSKGVTTDSLRRDHFNYVENGHTVAWRIDLWPMRKPSGGMQFVLVSVHANRRVVATGGRTKEQVWLEFEKKSKLCIKQLVEESEARRKAKDEQNKVRQEVLRYQEVEESFGFRKAWWSRRHALEIPLFKVPIDNYAELLRCFERLAPEVLEEWRIAYGIETEKGEE